MIRLHTDRPQATLKESIHQSHVTVAFLLTHCTRGVGWSGVEWRCETLVWTIKHLLFLENDVLCYNNAIFPVLNNKQLNRDIGFRLLRYNSFVSFCIYVEAL